MASVAVLPRVRVHRTPSGTSVERWTGSGLLARDAAGRCRSLTSDEPRRPLPEAGPAWLRLAALLQRGDAGPRRAGRGRRMSPGPSCRKTEYRRGQRGIALVTGFSGVRSPRWAASK
jgi:hypothetical protein